MRGLRGKVHQLHHQDNYDGNIQVLDAICRDVTWGPFTVDPENEIATLKHIVFTLPQQENLTHESKSDPLHSICVIYRLYMSRQRNIQGW